MIVIILLAFMAAILFTYAVCPMLGLIIHDAIANLWHKYIKRK
jgi:hypothetical protein